MLVDIVAKGGNLLLNVGPRGADAHIPDAQLTRLGWLADWVSPNADAIFATRPWITGGSETVEGEPVRYTARGETVYAFVPDGKGSVTLPEVAATPTTDVTDLAGGSVAWRDTVDGLSVDRPGSTPGELVALALHRVTAVATGPRR